MKLLRPSSRLLIWSSFWTLLAPIAVLQTIALHSDPWWKIPAETIRISLLFGGFIGVITFWFAVNGKNWFLSFINISGLALSGFNLLAAIFRGHFWQAVFGIIMATFFSTMRATQRSDTLKFELEDGLNWYQGLPEAIPLLHATIESKDLLDYQPLLVSRLEPFGISLFSANDQTQKSLIKFAKSKSLDIELSFNSMKAKIMARPTQILSNQVGLSLRIKSIAPDQEESFSHIVEALKGRGYVQ